MKTLFLYIPIFFLSLIHVSGQTKTFSVSGTIVNDAGEGLPAQVVVHELQKGVMADLDGEFEISRLRRGSYHLHITMMGYQSASQTIIVKDEDLADLHIVMKESTFNLEELTIEANPFKNGPLEHSQTIEVVDRAYLEKNNAGTFANALEKLPGITTINTGVGISKPVIRGLSFNRIMVNDRGIKQEGQQWGADHGLEIDPFDVDRVEVIKGPGSLIYGSDGMAGVINISPAPLPSPGTINADVMSTYRSNNNMWGNTVSVEGNENDFVFKGRFTMQDYEDYRVPTDRFTYAGFVLPVHGGRLKNTAGQERHFSVTGGLRKEWGHSTVTVSRFSQLAGIFPGAVGIPNSYNLQHRGDHTDIELPNQNNSHLKVISNTKYLLGKNWLELDLGYQKNNREEHSLPHTHGIGPTPSGTMALGLNLDTYTANLRYNTSQSETHQHIYGFQFQHMRNQKDGFEFLLPDFTTTQGGVFYFHEMTYSPSLILNAGIRVDGAVHDIQEHLQPIYRRQEATGEFDQRNPDINRSMYNASGGTGLSWIINDSNNLKVNLGTSYRIPTAIELASNGVHHGNFRHEIGNADLESERSYQIDLNYTYRKKNFYVGISPYFSFYDNFIYLAPTGLFSPLPASSMMWEYRQNDSYFLGAELKTEFAILPSLRISTALEYVYNQNLDTGLPLPLTPPFSALTRLEYSLGNIGRRIENFYVFGEVRNVATQDRVDRNERITEGYTLFESGIGMDFRFGNQLVKLNVSGQNLTDAYYFNHLSRYRLLNLPEQGRNINFSIKVPVQIRK
ncbi:TonB-dependent receptor [Litoribacter ruber]|uniref:TonB-dependent receptor n=1 Tax=Litoribacter ruber TaxID=702568 RepID=UPI001FE4E73F|nr:MULTISPECIES: TonB-dependent receptor [Litoribacter]